MSDVQHHCWKAHKRTVRSALALLIEALRIVADHDNLLGSHAEKMVRFNRIMLTVQHLEAALEQLKYDLAPEKALQAGQQRREVAVRYTQLKKYGDSRGLELR